MPSSWTQNFYHAVYGTRHRTPWISAELEARLHPFLGGIAKQLNCTPIAINGMDDHVHVLVRYPSVLSNADLVQNLKSRSSKWIHEEFRDLGRFVWQKGYGGFTVSRSQVDVVEHYIRRQKEHHKRETFEAEHIKVLRKTGWEGDTRDLFD